MQTNWIRTGARLVAIVAAALAVADGFRWGNRWYVSSMFTGSGEAELSADLLAAAHSALVHGLAWLAVAVVAAVIGWRLRVVARPRPT